MERAEGVVGGDDVTLHKAGNRGGEVTLASIDASTETSVSGRKAGTPPQDDLWGQSRVLEASATLSGGWGCVGSECCEAERGMLVDFTGKGPVWQDK